MEPNKVRLRRWVANLRSGRFQQGQGTLHRVTEGQHTYCCLGVLTETAIEDGLQIEVLPRDEFDVPNYMYGSAREMSVLPPEVCIWSGLASVNPSIGGFTLAEMNDHYKWSFEKIADAIERHYGLTDQEGQETS